MNRSNAVARKLILICLYKQNKTHSETFPHATGTIMRAQLYFSTTGGHCCLKQNLLLTCSADRSSAATFSLSRAALCESELLWQEKNKQTKNPQNSIVGVARLHTINRFDCLGVNLPFYFWFYKWDFLFWCTVNAVLILIKREKQTYFQTLEQFCATSMEKK